MTEPKFPNFEQLKKYQSTETLLFLHISNGIIKRIDERFLP